MCINFAIFYMKAFANCILFILILKTVKKDKLYNLKGNCIIMLASPSKSSFFI